MRKLSAAWSRHPSETVFWSNVGRRDRALVSRGRKRRHVTAGQQRHAAGPPQLSTRRHRDPARQPPASADPAQRRRGDRRRRSGHRAGHSGQRIHRARSAGQGRQNRRSGHRGVAALGAGAGRTARTARAAAAAGDPGHRSSATGPSRHPDLYHAVAGIRGPKGNRLCPSTDRPAVPVGRQRAGAYRHRLRLLRAHRRGLRGGRHQPPAHCADAVQRRPPRRPWNAVAARRPGLLRHPDPGASRRSLHRQQPDDRRPDLRPGGEDRAVPLAR